MKLENGWMTDATIHAAQATFVSPEPIPNFLLPLFFSLYDPIFMPLIPISAVLFLIFNTFISVFIWHLSFLAPYSIGQYLSPIIEIVRFSPMTDSMTVAAKYLTFTDFLFQSFNRSVGSSNNTSDAEALIFPIAMVELDTCRMVLATLYTAQFALITTEP